MTTVKITPPRPQVRGYALVRDAQGNPKIDDPDSLPEEIRAMLTPEERRAIYGGDAGDGGAERRVQRDR